MEQEKKSRLAAKLEEIERRSTKKVESLPVSQIVPETPKPFEQIRIKQREPQVQPVRIEQRIEKRVISFFYFSCQTHNLSGSRK